MPIDDVLFSTSELALKNGLTASVSIIVPNKFTPSVVAAFFKRSESSMSVIKPALLNKTSILRLRAARQVSTNVNTETLFVKSSSANSTFVGCPNESNAVSISDWHLAVAIILISELFFERICFINSFCNLSEDLLLFQQSKTSKNSYKSNSTIGSSYNDPSSFHILLIFVVSSALAGVSISNKRQKIKKDKKKKMTETNVDIDRISAIIVICGNDAVGKGTV